MRAPPLGPAFDLLAAYRPPGALFERQGIGVATSKVREWVDPAAALMRLRELHGDGAGVAVGVLPFGGGGALAIAPRSVRRTAFGAGPWFVEVDEGDDTPIERVMGGLPSDVFEGLQLHEVPSPQAYADVVARPGTAVQFEVTGETSAAWSVVARDGGWRMEPGTTPHPARVVRASCDTGLLLFNALSPEHIRERVSVSGDASLAVPLLHARSVIV